jgi:hypothetical protein
MILFAGGYAGSYTTNNAETYDSFSLRTARTLSKALRDFNHDGKSDLLWRDTSGNVSMWLMNGTSIPASTFVANIWPGWSIVASGDFDGDGKADILSRDTAGNVAVWLMDGTTVTSNTAMGNVSDRQAQ